MRHIHSLRALVVLGICCNLFIVAGASADPTGPKTPKPPRVDASGDPLPEGAIRRFGSLHYRVPGGGVNSAISADGKMLAVTNGKGVILMDLDSGKQLRMIPAEIQITSFNGPTLAFTPDGARLAALTPGGVVRIWELASGKEIRVLGKSIAGPWVDIVDGEAQKKYFLPEGLRFVNRGKEIALHAMYRKDYPHLRSGQVRFIDAADGKTVREVPTGGAVIGLTSDQKTIISGDLNADGRIDRFDAATGKTLDPLTFDGKLRVATVTSDGKILVVGNRELTLFVWDLQSGERLHKFDLGLAKEESLHVSSMEVTPDGKTLLIGSGSGAIIRRDLATGRSLEPLRGHSGNVTDLFFRANGEELVSISQDGAVQRWDWKTGKLKGGSDGYSDWCYLALTPDGRTAIIADRPGRIDLWDMATGRRVRRLQDATARIDALELSPDGKKLAAGKSDNTIAIWDLPEGKERIITLPSGAKEGVHVSKLRFAADSKRLVSSTQQDGTRMWDVLTGEVKWSAASSYVALAFSPDGKSLVAAPGSSPNLIFLDPETSRGAPIRKKSIRGGVQSNQNPAISHAVYSPDGSMLAIAHEGMIRLVQPPGGAERMRLKADAYSAWEPTFSPDGKWLATTGSEGVLRVWEVLTGRELFQRNDAPAGLHAARFTPDMRMLVTVGRAGGLLWNVPPPDLAPRKIDESVWSDLVSDDAAKAFRAEWVLIANPKAAIQLLAESMRKVPAAPSADSVARWIAELDADSFDVREEASARLARAGQAVEPLLREALGKTVSAEQKRRLELLVTGLKNEASPDELAASRATQVLEVTATPEAKELLRNWAEGRVGAMFQRYARASLERMK